MSTDAHRTPLLSGTERRSILRESLAVLSSSHVATACGVIQNLIVLAVVPPRLIGIWTAVRTLLDFGNYSSLGINRAAGVEIAVAAGRGDPARIRLLANATMSLELCTAGVVAIALILAGAIPSLEPDLSWAAAFAVGAGIAVISRYHAFNLTVLRSLKKFGTLARARVFGAAAELILFSVAAWFFGFLGLLVAALVAQFVNACFVRADGGLRFSAVWDRALMLGLLASGWPMAAEALAMSALRSVDRFVIVRCLENGDQQLGWYKIAIVMGAWAFDQSNLVANVIFPRLGETLGRTRDPATVLRLGLRAAEVIALAMVLCAAALFVLGVPLVHWLLPAYRPGLAATGGLVVAACLLGTSMPIRYALLTIQRTQSLLLATGFAASVALGGGIVLLFDSGDLAGANLGWLAWVSAAAAGILLASTLGLCCVVQRELVAAAARVALAVTYLTAGAALIQNLQEPMPVAVLIAAVWIAIPTWLLVRRVDWKELIRKPVQTGDLAADVTDAS